MLLTDLNLLSRTDKFSLVPYNNTGSRGSEDRIKLISTSPASNSEIYTFTIPTYLCERLGLIPSQLGIRHRRRNDAVFLITTLPTIMESEEELKLLSYMKTLKLENNCPVRENLEGVQLQIRNDHVVLHFGCQNVNVNDQMKMCRLDVSSDYLKVHPQKLTAPHYLPERNTTTLAYLTPDSQFLSDMRNTQIALLTPTKVLSTSYLKLQNNKLTFRILMQLIILFILHQTTGGQYI